ncbi:hypothetical protein LEMLEM_LOCUS8450 [Lemmus lemmus]
MFSRVLRLFLSLQSLLIPLDRPLLYLTLVVFLWSTCYGRLEGDTRNLWHEVVTVATAYLACGDSGTLPLMDCSLCCWPQPWGSEKSLLPHHSCLLPSLCVHC